MEAIKIELENISGGIVYRAHVQNIGWQAPVFDGAVAGTTGQDLRLEAILMRLTGEAYEQYDVYYQCHVQNIGWMGWAKNGEPAGTAGHSYRVEAIKIILVNKNDPAPGDTADCFREIPVPHVSYSSKVQDIGWQAYVSDGSLSGTTGQSKRIEAIKINFTDDIPCPCTSCGIEYSAHIQNIGWQDFVLNDAVAGTENTGYRLEAIKIRLRGIIADVYDVYYQCHVENIGWMGWAKNGEEAGTAGHAYRVEAVKIILIRKGDPAPGPTADHFRDSCYMIPVKYIDISTVYEYNDNGWIHYGIDFAGNIGLPIYSATSGQVSVRDDTGNTAKGKYIEICSNESGRSVVTLYEHLNSIEVYLGQPITVGQLIGYMGSTGESSGLHLHFTMKFYGPGEYHSDTQADRSIHAVNPMLYCYINDTYTIRNAAGYSILHV